MDEKQVNCNLMKNIFNVLAIAKNEIANMLLKIHHYG